MTHDVHSAFFTERTARKEHTCDGGCTIRKGERYYDHNAQGVGHTRLCERHMNEQRQAEDDMDLEWEQPR